MSHLATGLDLHDPWRHGLTIMHDVCTRWTSLELTQVGSIIAIAGTLPAASRMLGRLWRQFQGYIRDLFLATITIPAGDPLNRSVVTWMLASKARHDRFLSGRTKVNRSNTDRAAALKKTQFPVQYAPRWNSRWFLHDGGLFLVTRAESCGSLDPNHDGFGAEELTIGRIGWSPEPIKALVETCREYDEKQMQFFVIIYSRDRYGFGWKPKARAPLRHLDTVHFDNAVKTELVNDVRTYLDPRTQKRYQSRSMPYRRGYLFYGPPGTGKSSLSVALAGEFGLDLYEVRVPDIATDADLEQLFHEIPPRCLVLLEDIDAVWTERAQKDGKEGQSNCTLSGLLNALDGVGSQDGRIVVMTTNRPDSLDSALIRPGRVDMKVLLGNISRGSAEDMFFRMFSPDLDNSCITPDELHDLARQFSSHIPEDTFTPSMLQGFFQLHLDSPRKAIASIADWVEKEMTKLDQSFEVVARGR